MLYLKPDGLWALPSSLTSAVLRHQHSFSSLFLAILQLHKWSGLENQTKPNHSDRCKTQLIWTAVDKRLSATGLLSGLLGQRRVSQPPRHLCRHTSSLLSPTAPTPQHATLNQVLPKKENTSDLLICSAFSTELESTKK